MPPRNRKAPPPTDEPPTVTGAGDADGTPAQRSRTRAQTRSAAVQDEELFDLDAVSGTKDDCESPRSNHGGDADSIGQGANSRNRINNPDTVPSSQTLAADIKHFFDKTGGKSVCVICRQVVLHPQLFIF